jgi:hypothetical protein
VAILSALQAIKNKDVLFEEKKIILYTDSKATIDLLKKYVQSQ